MKICRPLKNNIINQRFGRKNTHTTLLPFYNSLGLYGHNGIDFNATLGDKVYWNCDLKGEVIGIQTDIKLGYGVIILTKEKNKIIKHRHWHFLAIYCKIGQILESGDLMGWADSTGYSTGHHDHYDIKPQIEVNGVLKNEFQNNGYRGAIDPMPFYSNMFILDYVMELKRIEGRIAVIIEIIKRMRESFNLLLKGR